MQIFIQPDPDNACQRAAQLIVQAIKKHFATEQRPFVLGLPTGGSPLGVYEELVRLYKAGEISFKNVVTFNMDEYLGLKPTHSQSYHRYMHENFFDHVDIPAENINLFKGDTETPDEDCQAYEAKMLSYGGVDLFLGGMGENGHIAFNESGTGFGSRTRVVDLAEATRQVNARFFRSIDEVPKQALSIGTATLLAAKRIILIVTGSKKASAMKSTIEGGLNHLCPASALQLHADATIVCDKAAVAELEPLTMALFNRG